MTHIHCIILIQKCNTVTQYHIVQLHTVSLPSLSTQLTVRIYMIQSIFCYIDISPYIIMYFIFYHTIGTCMYHNIKCLFNRLVTQPSLKVTQTNSTLSITNNCTQGNVGFDTVPFYNSQLQSTQNKINHDIL